MFSSRFRPQGAILSGDAAEQTKDVLLLDVASLSLGIEVRASRVARAALRVRDGVSFFVFGAAPGVYSVLGFSCFR